MKFGQQRTPRNHNKGASPFKNRTNSPFTKRDENIFMHYNNGVYMGGMISYKRNGEGMVLLDDGTSAIINSCYDSLTGHNIFFGSNAIASLLHLKKDYYEIVLRTSHFILKVPYYNCDEYANGNGVLRRARQRPGSSRILEERAHEVVEHLHQRREPALASPRRRRAGSLFRRLL